MIRYSVKPIHPEAHLLEVRLVVPDPGSGPVTLYLPAWIRGSYMVRDFARHVVAIDAECDQRPVQLIKLDKQTWYIGDALDKALTLTYRVYAWDLSVRGAHVDTTHAYFNGPCLFLGIQGREAEPCEVEILKPDGERFADWRLAVSMPPLETDHMGFGRYRVSDYETLLDHPVEMSDFTQGTFQVREVPHRFVICGRQAADLDRICRDLGRICEAEAALFGELPVEEYLFLLWVVGSGYGGLEHKNSTSLMIGRDSLPLPTATEMTPGYRRLLGLCSHEYFHLWNVKRITPEVFQQEGTANEVYTRQLWIFEGITSYYDELLLLRSGVIEIKDYFEMVAEGVTRVMRGSGRTKQTLEESSFDAWTKFYKQDENAPNAIVSYYAKGALVAMMLDLSIRMRTDGDMSLDHVMRALWQQYGKPGVGLREGAFERLVEEVTGIDFKDDFDRWVRSTEELTLSETLREFGIELHLLPAKSAADLGGVADKRPEAEQGKPVLGARFEQQPDGVLLLQVFDRGAAQAAGLSAGDLIIAVDGLRMDAKGLESYLSQQVAESRVSVHLFRRDELMAFELKPLPAQPDTCSFYLNPELDDKQSRLQNGWLQGHAKRA
ncbi:MAG: PDZ domain-containing protein [Candidatus Thiodiazotropha sp.]